MGEDWVRRKEEKREGRFRMPVIVKIAAGLLLLCILCIVGYVVYMQANYYRIEDYAELEVENGQKKTLKTGETYTAVTYNIGFGAYGPDYSFFMDTGEIGRASCRESLSSYMRILCCCRKLT